MGYYPVDELFRKWANEDITVEQAIGQMMQHLMSLTQRQSELERQLVRAKDNIADLQSATLASSKPTTRNPHR